MKHPADLLTLSRMAGSIAIILCKPLSPAFWALYVFCGLTDMLDGSAARRTHSESEFGKKLDTGADALFAAACLVKLLPVLHFPLWVWLWAACIAAGKLGSWIYHFVKMKQFPAIHSRANKAAGVMLFLLPFTLKLWNAIYPAILICIWASFAAVQEAVLLKRERKENQYDKEKQYDK